MPHFTQPLSVVLDSSRQMKRKSYKAPHIFGSLLELLWEMILKPTYMDRELMLIVSRSILYETHHSNSILFLAQPQR